MDDAINEAIKNAARKAGLGRSVASDLFKQTKLKDMNIPNVPNIITERLNEMFSSGQSISDLAQELEQWKKEVPENKILVVMMRTPNGEVMDVEEVRANGSQFFIAEGKIKGMPGKVAGHIATLSLFFVYEEPRTKNKVGFKIVTEAISATPTKDEQKQRGSKKRRPSRP
jgi:hypothetical protein